MVELAGVWTWNNFGSWQDCMMTMTAPQVKNYHRGGFYPPDWHISVTWHLNCSCEDCILIASQLFSSNGLGLLFNIWSILSLFFYNLMTWKFGGTAVSYCLVLFFKLLFPVWQSPFFFFIYLNDFFVLGKKNLKKMDINKARKNMEKRKKKQAS